MELGHSYNYLHGHHDPHHAQPDPHHSHRDPHHGRLIGWVEEAVPVTSGMV